MSKAYHRDDQDWKSQTSDYSAPKRTKTKVTALQAAQEAEILSWKTLDAIQEHYLNDDDDITNEWSNFLAE